MNDEWYFRSGEGRVYGPADVAALKSWAEEGRIEPSGHVSQDRKSWMPAQLMPELEMTWVIEAEPGKFYGPFNRAVVQRLSEAGELPEGALVYRRHLYPVDQDPPPKIIEKRVEVPVEKIVEKIVEVPVEKIIEVEPPPRKMIVEAEAVQTEAKLPPAPILGGIFKNVDPQRLVELERAAQREITAARQGRGKLSGLFSRR